MISEELQPLVYLLCTNSQSLILSVRHGHMWCEKKYPQELDLDLVDRNSYHTRNDLRSIGIIDYHAYDFH